MNQGQQHRKQGAGLGLSGNSTRGARTRRSRPLTLERLEARDLLSFLPAVPYSAAGFPRALAVGDFTGDAVPDLVTANYADNTVSVLHTRTDGEPGFEAGRFYPAGTAPMAVAGGDFDGDGALDFVAINFRSNDLSVFLNDGSGAFFAAGRYAAGERPQAVAVADFNGDGASDLAVANYNSGTVSIHVGTGGGAFRPAVHHTAGLFPSSVAAADFDGDGAVDLAVTNYLGATVGVLPGRGDGSFGLPRFSAAGLFPGSIAVDDFNADGVLDLAVANYTDNALSVLPGQGDGSFGGVLRFPTFDWYTASLAAGDFDNDGWADLVTANSGSNTVGVHPGAEGVFPEIVGYDVGVYPTGVAVGDFNGDGFADLVVANYNSGDVSLLLNAGGELGPSPANGSPSSEAASRDQAVAAIQADQAFANRTPEVARLSSTPGAAAEGGRSALGPPVRTGGDAPLVLDAGRVDRVFTQVRSRTPGASPTRWGGDLLDLLAAPGA